MGDKEKKEKVRVGKGKKKESVRVEKEKERKGENWRKGERQRELFEEGRIKFNFIAWGNSGLLFLFNQIAPGNTIYVL